MEKDKLETAFEYMQVDFEKALELFDEILKEDPENIDAINGKASSYMKMQDYEKADELTDYSLSLKENPQAYLIKGVMSKNKEDHEMALKYLNKAIELDPHLSQVVSILKKDIMANK